MASEIKYVNSNLNSQGAYTKCLILNGYLNTPMNTIMSITSEQYIRKPVQQFHPADREQAWYILHSDMCGASADFSVMHHENRR